MDRTPLGGVSQSRRLAVAQTGDVDRDGEIVDALRRRVDEFVDESENDEGERRVDPGVLSFCRRAEARLDGDVS